MAKAGKAVWWVLREVDKEVLLYSGQDKNKAREVAAKSLKANPKDNLAVVKVRVAAILDGESLEQLLPKDAF